MWTPQKKPKTKNQKPKNSTNRVFGFWFLVFFQKKPKTKNQKPKIWVGRGNVHEFGFWFLKTKNQNMGSGPQKWGPPPKNQKPKTKNRKPKTKNQKPCRGVRTEDHYFDYKLTPYQTLHNGYCPPNSSKTNLNTTILIINRHPIIRFLKAIVSVMSL